MAQSDHACLSVSAQQLQGPSRPPFSLPGTITPLRTPLFLGPLACGLSGSAPQPGCHTLTFLSSPYPTPFPPPLLLPVLSQVVVIGLSLVVGALPCFHGKCPAPGGRKTCKLQGQDHVGQRCPVA
ncbi:MZT2B isoform 1 [Pan troglodytes]|uniref:MZT2B isoform 1 n=1 Tax=Pan troglodytes TaxID=9598 RepID=A0A2J8IQ77_PANTR|nr:MZT2B isoform 1 [Pan troglodytes]